jgi:hypothetical protein
MVATLLEEKIVARLQEGIDDISIVPFPSDPRDLFTRDSLGQIFVMYTGSDYERENLMYSQDAIANIEVGFKFRSLRGQDSLHNYMAKVRKLLIGWSCDLISHLFLKTDRIEKNDNGVWYATISFRAKYIEVAEETEDATYGFLKEIGVL